MPPSMHNTAIIVTFPDTGFVKDRCRTGHISDTCKAHVQLQEISEFPEHVLVQYRAQFPVVAQHTNYKIQLTTTGFSRST